MRVWAGGGGRQGNYKRNQKETIDKDKTGLQYGGGILKWSVLLQGAKLRCSQAHLQRLLSQELQICAVHMGVYMPSYEPIRLCLVLKRALRSAVIMRYPTLGSLPPVFVKALWRILLSALPGEIKNGPLLLTSTPLVGAGSQVERGAGPAGEEARGGDGHGRLDGHGHGQQSGAGT